MSVLDLFAGPGGWDEGALALDLHPLGIEQDESACLTRAAAGHRTIRADVSTYPLEHLPRVTGLIASPPCQAFSTAGKGEGRGWLPELHEHARSCVTGWKPWPHDTDPRIALVLEPLRWAITLVPDWIALEQVPPVLELWETFAFVFRALGWECWTGILNAADFGVPQTRRRAFLLAHRKFQPQPPAPTHCEGGASTMFGELLPWVSMAAALGWDGFEARYQRGAGLTERYGERPARDCELPSPTLTGSALGAGAGAKLTLHTNRGQDEGGNRQTRETSAPAPAPALSAKAGGQWIVRTGANTMKHGRTEPYERSVDEPAPTVDAKAGGAWAFDRPATTVCSDPRLGEPGHRDREGGEPQFQADALRLTVPDALRLQSFRADYPVQGTKTKQFEQIGNAVPPLLARHVLAALSGVRTS